jgi:hypothetical protein
VSNKQTEQGSAHKSPVIPFAASRLRCKPGNIFKNKAGLSTGLRPRSGRRPPRRSLKGEGGLDAASYGPASGGASRIRPVFPPAFAREAGEGRRAEA